MNRIYLMLFIALTLSFKAVLVSQTALDERSMGAIVVSMGLMFLAAAPIVILKKGVYLYASIVQLLVTVFLYIQFLYIGYFKVPMSLYILLQTTNAQGMGESVFGRLEWYHGIFFVDVVFLIALYFFHKKKVVSTPAVTPKMKWVFLLVLAVGIGMIALKPASMVSKGMTEEIARKYTPATFVGNYGIFGHQVLDAYQVFFQDKEIALKPEEKEKIQQYLSRQQGISFPVEGVKEGMFEGKNVIYLQIESLQNFVLNQTVEEKEITPFLNKMLQNSIHFSNFYPQTAEGNSSDAELLALSSIYPVKEGSTFFRFPEKNYPSILKDLKEKGYGTFAFHGDDGDFWNRKQTYPNLGFDKYYDIDSYEHTEKEIVGMGISDEFFFEETAKMLNEKKEPYAAYLISLTSHYPFEMPQKEKTMKLVQELKGTYLGNYLESIHYADQSLEKFFDGLSEHTKENSLFVIYGDHNGVFASHKKEVELWKNETIDDQEWLTEYSTVPFMIYNPSLKAQELSRIGGQIDIAPTVSYLMGLEEPEEKHSFGVNLLETQKDSVFLLKGDYGSTTVITKEGNLQSYGKNQYDALAYSERLIKSNFK